MSELALNIFCFICGGVIVFRAGEHIEMMRWSSNHAVRVAYWALAVGGLALVFSPLSAEPWLRPLGWIASVAGVTLLCIFDRRAVLDSECERARDRAAG